MVISGTINTNRFQSIKRLLCFYQISLIRSIIVTENDNPLSSEKLKERVITNLKQLWRDFSYPAMGLETGETRLNLTSLYAELKQGIEKKSVGTVTADMVYKYPNKGAFFQNHILDAPERQYSVEIVTAHIEHLANMIKHLFSVLIGYVRNPAESQVTFEKAIRYVNILELLDATFCILGEGNGVFVENDMGV